MTVASPSVNRIAAPVDPSTSALRPLGLDEVRITGGFWGALQRRNAEATIPHIADWLERAGWIGNFDAAAGGRLPGERRGREFTDSEVYKLLEALAWELSVRPDPVLQNTYDDFVNRVAAAQEPDGYLNTRFGRPGQPDRYGDLEWGHELYCYGHLIQAATARLRTGHDDRLVAVARAAADHVCATFGTGGIASVCGHPEIEPAMVEFGRATGCPRYIEQAALFVERRGHQLLRDIEWGRAYFQDDIPVRKADVLRGHAVRALYLAAGAVDVATESGDSELLSAVVEQWRNTVARRTYLTGGMGSQHQDEAFGEDFALPPDRAYSESCAGVASVMLSWRLLLATGGVEYADLIERTLYNVIGAAQSADGRAFFYTNTLHQRAPGTAGDPEAIAPRAASSLRAPWLGVSCCPPNLARTIAGLGGYLATVDADGLQLHQYADAEITTALPDGRRLHLTVATDYPYRGTVLVRNEGPDVSEWTLTLRVPPWAGGAELIEPDGRRPVAAGSVTVTRRFLPGDEVRLALPLRPRITLPDPRIDAVRGCAAVERGPLVLCAESTDLPAGASIARLRLDPSGPIADAGDPMATGPQDPRPLATASGALAGEVTGEGDPPDRPWPYRSQNDSRLDVGRVGGGAGPVPVVQTVQIPLVPYFLWANRGPSTMRVWLPVMAAAEPVTAENAP